MAQLLHLILSRSAVPSHAALHEAIGQYRFKLAVDEAYRPFESVDYLPCTLHGEDGGLKLRFEDLATYLAEFPGLQSAIGERDTLISLRSGGDPREDVCVLMLAAVLAGSFGALAHDSRKNALVPAETLLNQARSRFDELD